VPHSQSGHAGRERTRLAPSPTGALHLGNIRTFLVNWALARACDWRIILRIEDLDGPRVKPGAADQTIDILSWIGLDWDEGPTFQSRDLTPYHAAMLRLANRGLVYPCDLTRKQIEEAASAPHGASGESRFPPELRPPERPDSFDDPSRSWRLLVEEGPVAFADRLHGPQTASPFETVGDVVLWTKREEPSYQLAVVVDDHRQGVTQVVRGDDLLDSTARQILIHRALGLEPLPAYTHLPLIIGEDGRRLAKRHGDTRISHYREQGVPPQRIIGLLAGWSGLERREMSASQFAEAFDLSTMPRTPSVFTQEDDAWLLAKS